MPRHDHHVSSTLFPKRVPPEHGMTGRYKTCRCRPCTDAAIRWEKRYRLWRAQTGEDRLQPTTGTRRRLLALAWIGYSQRDLARHVGCTDRTIQRICNGTTTRVNVVTAAAVARAYDALSDRPPAEDGYARRSMAYARRQPDAGPPIAWDDDTIDDPDARPATLTVVSGRSRRAERILRYIDAYRIGLSIEEIAATEGITTKAVNRHLERHGRTDLARALWATRAQDENAAGRKTA